MDWAGEISRLKIQEQSQLEIITGDTDWNLAASTGTDEFTHEFSVDSGSNWTAFNVDNTTYSSMSSSIAARASRT